MERTPPPVTVLGLGAMGRALAGALLDAGHPTTVWNRTPGKAGALAARGAAQARDPAAAIAASDRTIACLLDYASVDAVLGAAGDALAGRTVVNLTNGAPAQARATGAWISERGARYVDGGIMAIPPMIGQRGALILYSGDESAYAAAEPALAVLARPVFLGADPGLAPLHDLALLSGMYGMFAGATHAVELLASAGVAAEPFTSDLLKPWLEAMMAGLPLAADAAESNAAMQVAGLENMLAASREQGVDDGLHGHLESSLHVLRAAA